MAQASSTRPSPQVAPPPQGSQLLALATLLAILVYVAALPATIASGTYDLWGGLLIAPMLVVVSLPVLRRLARTDGDPWLLSLLGAALLIKLVGALIRYFVTFNVLGSADATGYHGAGTRIAREFRSWEFAGPAFQEAVPELVGTPFIRLLTGIFYTFTGSTKLGGFVIFSWLGFWGLYLCYRAFRIAIPRGNHRLYAVLVFFLPSLVFWPSSIGKEAWMQLGIGVCAYATARILTHERGGFALLVVGLWATAMVRPHVSLILFFALAVAYVLRRPRARPGGAMPTKLLGILALLTIGIVLVGQTESFFGVEGSGATGIDQVLGRVEEQTAQGGSEFDTTRSASPAQFPLAAATVLFRPFPFEAGSLPAIIASVEGMVVLVLLLRGFRRLSSVLRMPYAAFAATFTVLFIFAFSAVSNFGILARQRTQVLPLVLVLAALPAVRRPGSATMVPTPRRPRRRRPTVPQLSPEITDVGET